MTTDAQPRARWYSIGGGDLLVAVVALAIAQTASRNLLGDPGLGWHLRTPEVILADGAWPTADPFSGPARGNYWLANQWLGDVPLWLGWKGAGLNGVAVATTLLLVLTYRLIYRFLRADGLAWPAAFAWTLAAAGASPTVWAARPNVLTFLGTAVLARVLTLFHEGRLPTGRLLVCVPAMFVPWANAHGGFVAGLGMLTLAAGVEFAVGLGHPDPAARSAARRRGGAVVLTGALSVAATLVNPYGWHLYPWVTSLLGDEYFMNLNVEWLSPNFHDPSTTPILAALVLFPAVFAVSRHRPNLVLLALALAWMGMALKGQRYVPIWIAVATPLLARAAAEIDWVNAQLDRLWAARPDFREPLDLLRDGGVLIPGLLVAGGVGWAVAAPSLRQRPGYLPVAGLTALVENWKPGEVVFHGPNEGGYLILHSGGRFPVWLDDRNEVYGKDGYEAYFQVVGAVPGWDKRLADWNVRWVAVSPETPLAYRLAERPAEWPEVFRDDLWVLFRKRP